MMTSIVNIEENVSSGGSTEKFARELFSKLPTDLIEQLYELYKLDFEMFNYEYKDFIIT